MEQKINITKCMIDAVNEIEKALESCQKSIFEIEDKKSFAKAAFDWSVAKGMVAGCYFVVNNLEDYNSNDVFQDMLNDWEERLHKMYDVIQVIRRDEKWDGQLIQLIIIKMER